MSLAADPLPSTMDPLPSKPEVTQPAKLTRTHKPRPNYAQIHRQPLPLKTHALPTFHPTNPLSLLRLAYTYLSQIMFPPSSHPPAPYLGYCSPETGAIHITDPLHIRALWEMGFFGKGTLSRSEPSWMDREKARLQARRQGGMTAEEATNARRAKRRDFKLERARLEAERISRQRDVEEGKISAEQAIEMQTEETAELLEEATKAEMPSTREKEQDVESEDEVEPEVLQNQEHLQLTPEEAFFLSYGLGVLEIRSPPNEDSKAESKTLGPSSSLLKTFAPTLDPSSPFLLNYVVYHHFRSLGWVVRPGIKFGVDYLLYYRGPVFSHAEFAVIIIPSYAQKDREGSGAQSQEKKSKDWWWLHCVNRVQSQVLKSLVLCYVDVPAPQEGYGEDVAAFLRRYKVREFIVRRWVANRMRD